MERRILHVITDLHRGGAEGVLLRLCLGLRDRGVKSRVVSLRRIGPIGEELQKNNIEVMSLDLPHFTSVFHLFTFVKWILWADVLDAWLYHSLIVAAIIGVVFRRPVLWNVRGAMQDYSHERRKTKLVLFVCRILSWLPKKIAYNSDRARINHEALGFFKNATILFNGFKIPPKPVGAAAKLRTTLQASADEKIILTVGRYHRHKDYPNYFKAVLRLLQNGEKLKMVMVGKDLGWDRSIFADRVPSEYRSHFYFSGEQTDLSTYYAGADLFVLPSMTESFPNVLGEAMMYEGLCVSTDVGAARELLRNDQMICPPQNPEALAQVIQSALRLPNEEVQKIRRQNRQRMEQNFTLDKMVDAHLDLYAASV